MKLYAKAFVCMMATATASVAMVGCRAAPETAGEAKALKSETQAALDKLYAWAPDMREDFEQAYGYVVFPSVGKAGLIVGGAYGRGEVFRQGEMIGYADITAATVGPQVGAQEYAEFILFQTEGAMKRFINDELTLAANASAVILKEGAGASVPYEDGVAVVVMPSSGAMAEASVGGQTFDFTPKEMATTRRATKASARVDADDNNAAEADADADLNVDNKKTKVDVDANVDTE